MAKLAAGIEQRKNYHWAAKNKHIQPVDYLQVGEGFGVQRGSILRVDINSMFIYVRA
jgi:hypothetical protein